MKFILTAVCAALLLTGCGAGGGGGSSQPSWPVTNKTEAAGYFDAQPLGASAASLNPGARYVPDTLISSDLIVVAPDGRSARLAPRCAGSTCTFRLGSETHTLSAFSFADTAGLDPVMWTGAMHLAQFRRDDYTAYGGWMENSEFVVAGAKDPRASLAVAMSTGWSPRTNPVSGFAEWYGTMVGRGYATANDESIYQGNAGVRVDFANSDVDVRFTRITELSTGARRSDMAWDDLPMQAGTFGGRGLEGRFYGQDHREVGGVFDRNQIVGAFGARRY